MNNVQAQALPSTSVVEGRNVNHFEIAKKHAYVLKKDLPSYFSDGGGQNIGRRLTDFQYRDSEWYTFHSKTRKMIAKDLEEQSKSMEKIIKGFLIMQFKAEKDEANTAFQKLFEDKQNIKFRSRGFLHRHSFCGEFVWRFHGIQGRHTKLSFLMTYEK